MPVTKLIYTIEDTDGDRSNMIIRVPTGRTIVELQTFADLVTADLWPIIDGAIVAITTEIPLTVGPTSHAIETNVEVEVGASFSLLNSADVATTLYIPTFSKNFISGGAVDLNNATVLSFFDHILTGDAPVFPTDENGLDLQVIRRGFETTRKRKR